MRAAILSFSVACASVASAVCAPDTSVILPNIPDAQKPRAVRAAACGDGWGVWGIRLFTDSAGNLQAPEWVYKAVADEGASTPTGDWVSGCEPSWFPSRHYLVALLQAGYQMGGAAACMVAEGVGYGTFVIEGNEGSSIYGFDTGVLLADYDADGINNLTDVDQRISWNGNWRTGFASNAEWLDGTGDGEGLAGGPEFSPPPSTPVPSTPYTMGTWQTSYSCDNNLAFGGETVPDIGGPGMPSAWNEWTRIYWRSPQYKGLPDHPKPYEGAYNMVRAGSGTENAYFSAVWGQRVTYIPSGTTYTNFQTGVRRGTATYWHRYVLIDGKATFQYWHPTSLCWRQLGVYFRDTTTGNEGSGTAMSNPSFALAAMYLIPPGFLPGELVGETASNISAGLYQVPLTTIHGPSVSMFQDGQRRELWNTGGGGGSGAGLTGQGVADAVYAALGKASTGLAMDGAGAWGYQASQGGGGAAEFIYGDGGSLEGDGGATGALEGSGLAGAGTLGDAAIESLQLDELAPDVQAAAVLSVALPRPGGGADIVLGFSSLPDTSTGMGMALESIRLLLRVGLSVVFIYKYALGLLRCYREV